MARAQTTIVCKTWLDPMINLDQKRQLLSHYATRFTWQRLMKKAGRMFSTVVARPVF
jgi:hypothetical protein